MDDEKLVNAMQYFPCIWQVNSRMYKDIPAKENAWKEVASKVCALPYSEYLRVSRG